MPHQVFLSPESSEAAPTSVPLTSMRSTESRTRLDRGDYLKKRSIDNITYREGCPVDKNSHATVRDEDPDVEKSSYASRDQCDPSSRSSSSSSLHPQKQEEPHPLYVIQKQGVKSNAKVTKVSKAYSFEEYWSFFDSIVEGCRCLSMTGACSTPKTTSFGNSSDEYDMNPKKYPGGIVNNDVQGDFDANGDNDILDQASPSAPYQATGTSFKGSSLANSTSSLDQPTEGSGTSTESFFPRERSNGRRSFKLLHDLERELSDDEDFHPAHRTSSCFVLHEKDKVNDIFR